MKEKVLEILKSQEGFVSGAAISAQLGVSRTAVWKAVANLRAEGYGIESATNRGYRLVYAPNNLLPVVISRELAGCPWQSGVQVLATVDSTNNYLKTLADQGAPAGTVAVADCQTGGRGRMGRAFLSPSGVGIYLSSLHRPSCGPGDLMHLTCAVAVAVCSAIEEVCGFRPQIKWTNDIIYGGRKLCGILTELSVEAESGRVNYAVVGIGINCNQKPEDFDPSIRSIAGSLAMVLGRSVDRSLLAAALIRQLYEMDSRLLTGHKEIMDQYRADCMTVGKPILLRRGDETRQGMAVGIADDGALLVDFGDGIPAPVSSGEVSVRGLYGYTPSA